IRAHAKGHSSGSAQTDTFNDIKQDQQRQIGTAEPRTGETDDNGEQTYLIGSVLSEFFHESRGQEHDHKLGNGKGIVDRPVIVNISQHILCIISGSHRVHNNDKEDQEHTDGHDNPIFIDRKSTRLNSSNVSSSYAVFCLKKKTTTEATDECRDGTE